MGLGRFAESLRKETARRTAYAQTQVQAQEEADAHVEADVGEGGRGGAHLQEADDRGLADDSDAGTVDVQQRLIHRWMLR